MKPVAMHHPGQPLDDDPPDRLVQLSETIHHPLIVQSGLTTTRDGQWALYLTVPATATVPIPAIESQAVGFPVVYEAQPAAAPRAGPAFPRQGR